MAIITGILLMLVIGFVYFYFTTFFEITKEPIKKKKVNISFGHFQKIGAFVLLFLILLLIFYLPNSEFLSDGNKSYVGSLLGSIFAVLGAVSAALITVNKNKKHEEQIEFPYKYAKLQTIIMNSRRYIFSLERFTFNIESLDDSDKYMFDKFDEFIEYYNQTLTSLAYISNEYSLEFIDLLKEELDLADTVLSLWKKTGSIGMYSYVYSDCKMFESDKAKKAISTGRKIDESDQDDTPDRVIDGKTLRIVFIPIVDEKVAIFIGKLVELDKEMRSSVK